MFTYQIGDYYITQQQVLMVVKRFFQLVFILLILLSLYLSLSPASSNVPMLWNDKLIHCMSYFALMLTLDFSWISSKQLIAKSMVVLLYSGLIEYGQSYIPGREMSLGDLAANALGILLFVLFVPVLNKNGVYQYLKLK